MRCLSVYVGVFLVVGCSVPRDRIVSGGGRAPAAVAGDPTPTPSGALGATGTVPTMTPRPTSSPAPTATPPPSSTPRPTSTPAPAPTATPPPTTTPRPTTTPAPTATPAPTSTPRPTSTPAPDASALDPALIYPATPARANAGTVDIRLLPVCLPREENTERWEHATNPILTIEATRLNAPRLAGMLGLPAPKPIAMGYASLRELVLDPTPSLRGDMRFSWSELFERVPGEGGLWLVSIYVCDDRGHTGRCAGPDAHQLVPRPALRAPWPFGIPLVVIPVNGCR